MGAVLQKIAKVGGDITFARPVLCQPVRVDSFINKNPSLSSKKVKSLPGSVYIKFYLAGAAPALEFDGDFAPFCELLKKICGLVRAGDAFFVHPDDDISVF